MWWIVDFAVPADHRKRKVRQAKSETRKKLWKIKLTVMLIITRALGTVPKSLERGLEELEIEQTSKFIIVGRPKYGEKFYRLEYTSFHSTERPSDNLDGNISQEVIIRILDINSSIKITFAPNFWKKKYNTKNTSEEGLWRRTKVLGIRFLVHSSINRTPV